MYYTDFEDFFPPWVMLIFHTLCLHVESSQVLYSNKEDWSYVRELEIVYFWNCSYVTLHRTSFVWGIQNLLFLVSLHWPSTNIERALPRLHGHFQTRNIIYLFIYLMLSSKRLWAFQSLKPLDGFWPNLKHMFTMKWYRTSLVFLGIQSQK